MPSPPDDRGESDAPPPPVGSLLAGGDLTLLSAAIDSANSMITVADVRAADQPLVFVNDYFCEFTGYAREEVLGRNCRFLQNAPGGRDEDQPGVQRIRDAVAAGERCKVLLRNYKKDGSPFWNELYLSPVRPPGGGPDAPVTHYVGVQNDVTDHLECERERLILAEAVRTLDESVIITGPDLDAPGPEIRFVNEAFEQITGYGWEEAVGNSPRMLQGPDSDSAETGRLKRDLKAGKSFRGETVNYRKNGERYLVQWTAAPVWAHAVHGIPGGLHGGPGMSGHSGGLRCPDLQGGPRDGSTGKRPAGPPSHYVASQRDVTARRTLEREVLEARSFEQARIARDLHDGPAQDVTALKFLAAVMSRQVGVDAGDPAALHAAAHDADGNPRYDTPQALAAHLLAQADGAAGRVRQVARGLMPVGVVRGELTAALTQFAAERSALATSPVGADAGPDVVFEGTPADEPDAPDVRNELYHLAREAVGNAIRHGDASRVSVSLRRGDGVIRLTVEDDGVGLPAEVAATAGRVERPGANGTQRAGVGLRSMRYRAEVLGGSLTFAPADGPAGRPGTRIVCTLSAHGPPAVRETADRDTADPEPDAPEPAVQIDAPAAD